MSMQRTNLGIYMYYVVMYGFPQKGQETFVGGKWGKKACSRDLISVMHITITFPSHFFNNQTPNDM